ncbi:Methyltransferase domain-containing protein [Pseudomonas delhiensis]|uniref:Methyltransferase domain-containing protein n=1 Tax=Pseudomonas delhiensis TaxID=366289 RepID=A0A239HG93_9PSED|nr:class I SAM-dependent methyltransferase [Pseudomonas delhiensis]SDJ51321.1 Methyltransferase domain-containing protein [Pseudomonas delhiensis]SNS80161.1 Methyltransferase domain-containing protein [Pseudomonas delhiensis]
MKSKIIINDYSTYSPKRRDSLENSPVRYLLDKHYLENKTKIENKLNRFISLKEQLCEISRDFNKDRPQAPNWINGWLPGADALSLYGYAALGNPRHYVEVGSGNSTKFVRQAIKDHDLQTRIISIDPCPRAEIDAICDEVVRAPLEELDTGFFSMLQEGDVFFIDNSHRSFQNSDVTVFFTEILPTLRAGITIGIHDIYLPFDYPNEWADRFYNEQYLLCCYLLGGMNRLEIELPLVYLYYCTESMQLLNDLWADERMKGVEKHGAAFWLRTT